MIVCQFTFSLDYLVLLEYRNAIDTHVGYCIKLNVISSILAVFYKKNLH